MTLADRMALEAARTLAAHQGNKAAAARELDIDSRTLAKLVQKGGGD